MTRKIKISLLALIGFILASCSSILTESSYGEYSSYEKYESKYKVKNKEGLELGEARIPRIKKQIYQARLNDSTILDLKWITKRPIVGHHFISRIDSSLTIKYLPKLVTINDSIFGIYKFTDFNFEPPKNYASEIDSTENNSIRHLHSKLPLKQSYQSNKQIQIIENGRCYYSDYVPGGPDSGGGRHLKFSGNILFEGDTVTAILYHDVLYKIPIRPFEIKLVKNRSNDTLQSVIDGEISSQYGYIRIDNH